MRPLLLAPLLIAACQDTAQYCGEIAQVLAGPVVGRRSDDVDTRVLFADGRKATVALLVAPGDRVCFMKYPLGGGFWKFE